jgi:hypothetical protein
MSTMLYMMSGLRIADAQLHRRPRRQPKARILKPRAAIIDLVPKLLVSLTHLKERMNSSRNKPIVHRYAAGVF